MVSTGGRHRGAALVEVLDFSGDGQRSATGFQRLATDRVGESGGLVGSPEKEPTLFGTPCWVVSQAADRCEGDRGGASLVRQADEDDLGDVTSSDEAV